MELIEPTTIFFLILWLSAQGVYKLDSRPFLWGNIEWEIFSGK